MAVRVRPATSLWDRLMAGNAVAALLTAAALIFRVAISLTTPAWQGPDEPKHFEYVRRLVDLRSQLWAERRLPRVEDASPNLQRQIIQSMEANRFWSYAGPAPSAPPESFYDLWQTAGTELNRPSLYYDLAAVALLPFQGASLEQQLLVTRQVSAVLSAATVAVTYFVARVVSPVDRFVPVVAAGFLAFLPMHAFIGGVANSDNLLTLLGTLPALALALGFRKGFRFGEWALLAGGVALAILTKRAAVALLPAIPIAGLAWVVRLKGRQLVAVCGIGAVLVAVGAALLAGPARRAISSGAIGSTVAAYALNDPPQLSRLLAGPLTSPQVLALVQVQLGWFFESFWGIFGWFAAALAPWAYWVLGAVAALVTLGLAGRLAADMRHARRGDPVARTRVLVVLAYLVLIAGLTVLAVGQSLSYFSEAYVPQGRYMFVAVAPIAVCWALGLRTWLPDRLLGPRGSSTVAIAANVLLAMYAYFGRILPYFSRS